MPIANFISLTIAALLIAAAPAAADEVVELNPRNGVKLRVAVIVPGAPKAVAILFTGGAGKLGIRRNGTIKNSGNFLVRTRAMFAGRGLVAMVPDVSSDRKKGKGLRAFRHSKEYTEDLRALIRYARKTFKLPVWFIGTSAGTISVANAAERLTGADRPDGLVFTASITENSSHQAHVLDFDLGKYTGPVLIVHHRQDVCRVTPASGTDKIKAGLEKASKVEELLFDGGDPEGDVCQARHFHGFAGIEEKVVGDIANWMLARRP